jgi:AraC family transcriptional regulator of arabinose operon
MDRRVAWAVQEIDQQLGAEIDVAALAAAVNLSPSRFAHLFRRDTGLSPARFIIQRRLDRATVLLRSTFLSVKEVMASGGFNDANHFTRVFREQHGLSPTAWRAANSGAPTSLEVAMSVK